MYFKPAGPLSMRGVLATSWRLYLVSFRHCWLLSLLSALQSALLASWLQSPSSALTTAWMDALPDMDLQALYASAIRFVHATSAALAASALVSALLLAALLIAPLAIAAGEAPIGAARALGLALRRLPGILAGSVLTLLLIGAGLVLLLLPGLYWWARVQLWLVPVLAEQSSVPRAIERSWELTRGHWWRVSTLLSVPLALVWLGSVAGAWLGAQFGGQAPWVFAALLAGAARVFTLPYLASVLVVLYDDLEKKTSQCEV